MSSESLLEVLPSLHVACPYSTRCRPAGNIIAAVQTLQPHAKIIFYERNGLRHGDFTLRVDAAVTALQWNADSDVLALLLKAKDEVPLHCVECILKSCTEHEYSAVDDE